MNDKNKLLAGHTLFAQLKEEDIGEIAKLFIERHFNKNEILFMKGDDSHEMMLVVTGRIHIIAASAEGREMILNDIGPGGIIGEIALLDGKPRSAQATVVEDCRMLVIRRRDFLELLRKKPDLAIGMMEQLCQKLRNTSATVENLALNSIAVRVALYLLEKAKIDLDEKYQSVTFTLQYNQGRIGNFIGSGRERLNRVLSNFGERGIISIGSDHKTITILNINKLKKIAENLA